MAGRVNTAWLAGVCACALAAPAAAAPAQDDRRVVVSVDSSLAGRFNPLGVFGSMRLNLRWHPVRKNDILRSSALGDQLFTNTSLGVSVMTDVTPAFVRAGAAVEVTPLSIWRLRLNWQVLQSFGLFNQFLEFGNVADNYDAAGKRMAREREGALRPRLTQRLLADSSFQFRLWRVVILNQSTAELSHLGNGAFYNGEYDLLVNGRDVVLRNVLLAGVVLLDKPGLPEAAVGGFHMWTRALGARLQNQQAGLAVVFAPVVGKRQPRGFTMISLLGFHLEHQHRQHTPFLAWLVSWSYL